MYSYPVKFRNSSILKRTNMFNAIAVSNNHISTDRCIHIFISLWNKLTIYIIPIMFWKLLLLPKSRYITTGRKQTPWRATVRWLIFLPVSPAEVSITQMEFSLVKDGWGCFYMKCTNIIELWGICYQTCCYYSQVLFDNWLKLLPHVQF